MPYCDLFVSVLDMPWRIFDFVRSWLFHVKAPNTSFYFCSGGHVGCGNCHIATVFSDNQS